MTHGYVRRAQKSLRFGVADRAALRTSRRPSADTPVAITTAWETTRAPLPYLSPPTRSLQYVASRNTYGERLLAQVAGVERGHVGVQLRADPRDLGLGDPRLGTQRGHQVVDLAGRDAVHVGLHHHRVQGHVDRPPRPLRPRIRTRGPGAAETDVAPR